MKLLDARVALAGALLFSLGFASLGCASLGSGSGSPPPRPEATAGSPPKAGVPAASEHQASRGPTLDRQGCDPGGKAHVVVVKDGDGRANRWRYFSTVRRGAGVTRVLKCEAADSNGDGYVDARYFYDGQGRLLLEQRDLDFDGHAEVIADYSHFSAGHLTRARDID